MVHTSVNSSSSFNKPFVAIASTPNNLQRNALQKAAIAAIQNLGLQIEICGSWIWVFGADSSHAFKLIEANFKWSYRRGCWYFCSTHSKPKLQNQPLTLWDMETIRKKYGSQLYVV